MKYKPTAQQEAIYQYFGKGQGNCMVEALAGSGKTSTILEGIKYAREGKILLVAYNKHIAKELEQRLDNPAAVAKTIHSIGNGILRKEWPWADLKADTATDNVVRKAIGKYIAGSPLEFNIIRQVGKVYTQAREVCPFAANDEQIAGVIDQFDLYPDDYMESEGFDVPWLCEKTLEVMQVAQEKRSEYDFTDMIWLPLVRGWIKPQYTLIVVDETQDLGPTQLEVVLKLAKGRICVVGDSRQCIYSFRGADMQMMENMRYRLKAQVLPMTITQRCPRAVVTEAQKIVPEFEAAEHAKEGKVGTISAAQLSSYVNPGDAVLSRTNAILSKAAFQLLKDGVSVQIIGKDLGARIVKQIKSFKCTNLNELCAKVVSWSNAEQAKALAANRKNRAEVVRDQAETILFLAEDCESIPELVATIETLFDDKVSPVYCSTVHRAKGKEWDTVFLLDESFVWTRSRAKKDSDMAKEEANIEYVAITRSKNILYWVQGRPGPTKKANKVYLRR